jgi:serine protease
MRKVSRFVAILALVSLVAVPMAFAQDSGENDGRYMIKFKEFNGAARTVVAAGGTPVIELEPQGVVAAYLPEQALRGLQNHPNVEYIEVDARRYLMGQTTPYGIAMVQANDAVFGNNNSSACTVCIIDSGYYRDHEDLQTSNVSGTNDSGTGFWYQDSCGHGTHVAGTIAALNNTVGVVGVNSNGSVKIWIEKVFDGSDCKWTYSSSLVEALNRCRNNNTSGKLIVSMSLGGSFSSKTEDSAFQNAYNAGVLSIAAAGNDGSTRKSYPASYASVISVAAVDSVGVVASFSQKNDAVEIAAPGVGVLSTVPFKAVKLAVSGNDYLGANVDGSARTDVSGALADGGRCTSVGAWSGKVVLCERGDISFADKVKNVVSGGGVAAVIYNNEPGGFFGTLNGSSTIPAISISQEDGVAAKSFFGKSSTVHNSLGVGSGYEAWDGTSMATPHVSGVAALVWSNFTGKTNAEIRDALQKTAEDRGAAGKDNSYGYGIVKAKAAYDYLGGGSSTPTNAAPVANFTFTTSDLKATFTDTSTDSDGSVVAWSWNFGDGTTSTSQHPTKTYAAAGTYTVTLTVTDNAGATGTASKSVSVTSGSTATLVISNVASAITAKNGSFEITWTTNLLSNSEVRFTKGSTSTFTDANMVTSHRMTFRGSKGVLYEYYVSSTDANGNKATSGPHTHQN